MWDWIFYKTTTGKEFEAAREICSHKFCTRRNVKKKAFLDLLLEANESEGNPLSFEELRDEVFIFAGYDTTGALIAWTLFCLGNELEVQKKVHEELHEVLGDADDTTTVKRMPNLK